MNHQFVRGIIDTDAARDGKPGDPIPFIASTPGIKRDGLDLDQGLWFLENFLKNPVFLWAHDYMGNHLPVGRVEPALDLDVLRVLVFFDQEDDFARRIERKYRNGFLHSVSVGWNDIEVDGLLMYDLLDVSGVPVPGDPDALIGMCLTNVTRGAGL